MKRKDLLLGYILPIGVLAITITIAVVAFTRVHAEQTAKAKATTEARVVRPAVSTLDGRVVFDDVEAQSRKFMGYYHSINLTSEQQLVLEQALEPMPAACCANSSALTCCCPCNLSKTIWGLSRYLITEHGADAKQIRIAVYDWMRFVNPRGFKGNACYTGGCGGPFETGGCGGMQESDLVL